MKTEGGRRGRGETADYRWWPGGLTHRAQVLDLTLRPPPPKPTSCCGRGYNGCVWEGFFAAASFWREDALQLIRLQACHP
jgi:hypothetical protein